MEHYAGTDVSLERSSVRAVDAAGRIVREAKVASEPEALVRFFNQPGVPVTRIGLEAGPLSQWLHAGLSEAVLLGTRHVKAVELMGWTAPAPGATLGTGRRCDEERGERSAMTR